MDKVEGPLSRPAGCIRRRRAAVAAAALAGLVLAAPAGAQSNLSGGYPGHQCGAKPVAPDRPEEFRDRAELDAYNEKVHAFNASMEQYIDCLQRYVDNAAADIRTIREKLNAALNAVKP